MRVKPRSKIDLGNELVRAAYLSGQRMGREPRPVADRIRRNTASRRPVGEQSGAFGSHGRILHHASSFCVTLPEREAVCPALREYIKPERRAAARISPSLSDTAFMVKEQQTEPAPLGVLVSALLCAGEFTERFDLTDSWPLHEVVIAAAGSNTPVALLSRVGYRPDPMVGRRVVGLDHAIAAMVHEHDLIREGDGWRCSGHARSRALTYIGSLDEAGQAALGGLSADWQRLLRRQRRLRSNPHPVMGPPARKLSVLSTVSAADAP